MKELIRDTALGHFLRLVSKQKILPYSEDVDSSIWQRYTNKEKSGNMAHHGAAGEEEKSEEDGDSDQRRTAPERDMPNSSRESSGTIVADTSVDARRNEISGVVVDPEKGKDVSVVDWYSDDDPEVCHQYFLLKNSTKV